MKRWIACILVFALTISLSSCGLNDKRLYEQAQGLLKGGEYEQALEIFETLDYEDSADCAKECRYQMANSYVQEGNYKEAEVIFNELGTYKDSGRWVTECSYQTAEAHRQNGEYAAAELIYQTLGTYKESATRVSECRYQEALTSANSGQYKEAVEMFGRLDGYADSAQKKLENMYAYVKANYNRTDTTTSAYLTELENNGYSDSQTLAQNLYQWQVRGAINMVGAYDELLGEALCPDEDICLIHVPALSVEQLKGIHVHFNGGRPDKSAYATIWVALYDMSGNLLGTNPIVNDREIQDDSHVALDWNPGMSNSGGFIVKAVAFIGVRENINDELKVLETIETLVQL